MIIPDTIGLADMHILAYVGPGAGLSAIGALLALFTAVVVALFGFIWYPIRRMLNSGRSKKLNQESEIT